MTGTPIPDHQIGSCRLLMELQPTLIGERIVLRPVLPDDFTALHSVAADPLIWEQHAEPTRYQEPVFRRFFQGALDSGGAFIVLDRQTNQMIGSSRYFGYDEQARVVEIGWTFLARSHWGGAINGEMKRLMLEHAFRFVDRVIFVIGPENWRSRRAVEKIGGTWVDTISDPNGVQKVVYQITAAEFATHSE